MKIKIKSFILLVFLLLIFNYFLAVEILNKFILDIQGLGIQIITNHVGESLKSILFLDLLLTFLMVLPIGIRLLYENVKDALYQNEQEIIEKGIKRLGIPYLLCILALFFSYYVTITYTILYLSDYSLILSLDKYINLSSIFGFTLLNMFYFSIIFQTPLIIHILVKYKIISKELIKSNRKHFFIGILIFSGLIGSDLSSMIIFTLPTYLFYELGIIVS